MPKKTKIVYRYPIGKKNFFRKTFLWKKKIAEMEKKGDNLGQIKKGGKIVECMHVKF